MAFEFEIYKEGLELILRTYIPPEGIVMTQKEIEDGMRLGNETFREMLTKKGWWSKEKGYIIKVFESTNKKELEDGRTISEYHVKPAGTPAGFYQ